jgi:phosphoglycerate dehydrogenase-like enzyme
MSELIIASQMEAGFNRSLREQLSGRYPGVQVLDIPTGVPSDLPARTSLLLGRPINVRGYQAPEAPPPGWPYGLRWIQLSSSGIDAYPSWLFEHTPVTTARGSASDPIAEFVLAHIFTYNKHLPDLWKHDADWHFTALTPVQGQTLGLLGFGSIGSSLARKALALGMKVVALRQSDTPLEVAGVTAARDIHELFAQSDHLVLAAPLTAATRHIVNAQVLASAKPGLHLINIARGGLLDQDALLNALDAGPLGFASLDVTEPEPLPDGHPLYSHPKVRLSPHTSAISTRSHEAISAIFVENLDRLSKGEALVNLANPERG